MKDGRFLIAMRTDLILVGVGLDRYIHRFGSGRPLLEKSPFRAHWKFHHCECLGRNTWSISSHQTKEATISRKVMATWMMTVSHLKIVSSYLPDFRRKIVIVIPLGNDLMKLEEA